MPYLDLSVHERDEYEGKLFECHGATYVVGEFLGMGLERVVHSLINQQSGLSLLVIKVLKHPRQRGMYTQAIARLRADSKLGAVIPATVEVEILGGMVELQPNFGPLIHSDPAEKEVDQAEAALQGEAPSLFLARQHFEAALAINPFHTEALYGLAHALWRLKMPFDALQSIDKAVQIEPNLLRYRQTHIELARATQQPGFALELFYRAERDFADMHDLDELGVEVLLDVGDPDSALKRVATAMVGEERKAQMRRESNEAAAARRRARALMMEARERVMARQWEAASKSLLSAQRVYNRDPELCMNTAFAAMHVGEPRLCAGLMMYASMIVTNSLAATCAANAGFALLLTDELEQAIGVLDLAATRLKTLHGTIPETPVDLPGVGVWIDGDELREEPIPVAADLLEQGLRRAKAAGLPVSDGVCTLARAYRVAASAMG